MFADTWSKSPPRREPIGARPKRDPLKERAAATSLGGLLQSSCIGKKILAPGGLHPWRRGGQRGSALINPPVKKRAAGGIVEMTKEDEEHAFQDKGEDHPAGRGER